MTTPSSVPAQGEAMEVLREFIELHAEGNGTGSDAAFNRWKERLEALVDRARALVAASPCEAQPEPDNCVLCLGAKGGVRGNENLIGGHPVCDYCSAALNRMGFAAAAAQGGQQPFAYAQGTALYWPDDAAIGEPDCIALYTAPAPAAPLTARMLTPQEVAGIDAEFYGGDPTEYANAAIRKFFEVNGITLAGTAGTKKESE